MLVVVVVVIVVIIAGVVGGGRSLFTSRENNGCGGFEFLIMSIALVP